MTATGLAAAARAARTLLLFVLLPVLVALVRLADLHDRFDMVGFDFRGTLWEPAGRLLDGASPYPQANDVASLVAGNPSVYPPLPISIAIPLAPLGFDVAFAVWALALVAGAVAALWLVGVRDWRTYSLVLLCPPVVEAVFFGNITLLLLLPLAAAWRWRHAVRAGVAVGAAVAVKPLFVPLIAWLLVTRRFVAAAVSVASAAVLILVPWALIGFDGLREYPRLLERLDEAYGPGTDSLPSALAWVGSSDAARRAVCLIGVGLLVVVALRLRTRPYGDLCAFATMVAASVVAVPIVWPHYLALLLVPLAIAFPRPNAAWTLPYLLPAVLAIDARSLRATAFIVLALAMLSVVLSRAARDRDWTIG